LRLAFLLALGKTRHPVEGVHARSKQSTRQGGCYASHTPEKIRRELTAFARMILSARNCASPAVKFWIAPLVGLLEQSTTARITHMVHLEA
jgi:hypothetical protein